jgi:hypothetical protein
MESTADIEAILTSLTLEEKVSVTQRGVLLSVSGITNQSADRASFWEGAL